jgi:2-polyprenyl-3-methyl-5-hydroxy-6-metoxy-1,4-benzoquinol methylase
MRVRIFELSRKVVSNLPAWTRSVHSLSWLHVLNADDLDAVTMASYSNQAGAEFDSEEHNLGGLWSWEEAAFRQCLSERANVLIAGAGGGREMIALAKMGFNVFGFDASEDLTKACRDNLQEAGVPGEIVFAPPGEVPSRSQTYDALVVGRGVYHHIPGRARRIKFLKACRQLLKDGSPLVMGDFLTRAKPRSLTDFALSKKVEPGDSVTTCFFHFFTREEIVSELGQSGFESIDYRVTPFPGGGDLAHVIARSSSGE